MTPPRAAREPMLALLGAAMAVHTGDVDGYDLGVVDEHGRLDEAAAARLLLAAPALLYIVIDALADATGLSYERTVQAVAAHLVGTPAPTES